MPSPTVPESGVKPVGLANGVALKSERSSSDSKSSGVRLELRRERRTLRLVTPSGCQKRRSEENNDINQPPNGISPIPSSTLRRQCPKPLCPGLTRVAGRGCEGWKCE